MKKYILILLLLAACGKAETVDLVEIEQAPKYIVRYFAHSDSMFIRYNVDSVYVKDYFVGFDTMFTTNGGWWINFHVTVWDWPMNAGVIVNGQIIDNCSNQWYFGCDYYLE